MSYKADFHTHSIASPDGALRLEHYRRMLDKHILDYIAVTDHNTIAMAARIKDELGDHIIIGEEITTKDGEIIGLYLNSEIPPNLSAQETVLRIKNQGGLVYIPHPFETVRKGINTAVLESIVENVDIIEIYNGRAVFQNYSRKAKEWAMRQQVAGVAASDAHGRAGWGRTYTVLDKKPTPHNLKGILTVARYVTGFPGVRGMLYPKFNRIRKRQTHA